MAQAAMINNDLEARLVTATVIGRSRGSFRVLADAAVHEAALAASCLLQPEPQDVVLLACLEDGATVILSVLFRDEKAQALLRLPDQSALECRGSLAVRGAAALNLQSGKRLTMESDELHVSAVSAEAEAVSIKTVCDTAQMCCRALTTLGHTALSAFRSLTQCLGESKRMVQGADETHCGNSTLVADENATVMSTNSLSLAKESARTDAKLIQLG